MYKKEIKIEKNIPVSEIQRGGGGSHGRFVYPWDEFSNGDSFIIHVKEYASRSVARQCAYASMRSYNKYKPDAWVETRKISGTDNFRAWFHSRGGLNKKKAKKSR